MTDLREQEMQSQIDALSSTAENWKNTAKNLKTENQMLKAQVAQLQKMVYGSRTEKTKRILPETADGQLNLFNEAECARAVHRGASASAPQEAEGPYSRASGKISA